MIRRRKKSLAGNNARRWSRRCRRRRRVPTFLATDFMIRRTRSRPSACAWPRRARTRRRLVRRIRLYDALDVASPTPTVRSATGTDFVTRACVRTRVQIIPAYLDAWRGPSRSAEPSFGDTIQFSHGLRGGGKPIHSVTLYPHKTNTYNTARNWSINPCLTRSCRTIRVAEYDALCPRTLIAVA